MPFTKPAQCKLTLIALSIIMLSAVVGAVTMWLVVSNPLKSFTISIVTLPVFVMLLMVHRRFFISPWQQLLSTTETFLMSHSLQYPPRSQPLEVQNQIQLYIYAIAERCQFQAQQPSLNTEKDQGWGDEINRYLQNEKIVFSNLITQRIQEVTQQIMSTHRSEDAIKAQLEQLNAIPKELDAIWSKEHNSVVLQHFHRDVLAPVLSFTAPLFDQQINLVQHHEDEVPVLKCDTVTLRQALFRLLVTATNHTHGYGTITLKTYCRYNTFCIAISDGGDDENSQQQTPLTLHQLATTSLLKQSLKRMSAQLSFNYQIGYGTTAVIKLPIHKELSHEISS
ncbi:HAMP domain-containing histidine kinase [Thaumasiovibrio subtropicus]|uniref:HAMP domain-containing histidine kinase n=1 Tax=Thaumasiovibrio subtropicus TaxID=1891207 RepID=UPI000B35491B|nr:HAMP domain-containing histidine kinase [Thaumasiovibrio subtropicus]